jgi:hypothetical protein
MRNHKTGRDESRPYKSQMNYDKYRHHRRSIRLKGYDYSEAGAYFATICTQGTDIL